MNLKELNDKIKQEDLMEKMDKFKQNAKINRRVWSNWWNLPRNIMFRKKQNN